MEISENLDARLKIVYIFEFLCRSGMSALKMHLADLLYWEAVVPGPQRLPSGIHLDLASHGCFPTMTERGRDTKACGSRRCSLLCLFNLTQKLPDSFAEPSLDIKTV